MLSIECPNCRYVMKLAKFKPGKFSPTCKKCGTKFQLLIKSDGKDGFRSKTAPMSSSTKPLISKPIVKKTTPGATQPEITPVEKVTAKQTQSKTLSGTAADNAGSKESSDFKLKTQVGTQIENPGAPVAKKPKGIEKPQGKKPSARTKPGVTEVGNANSGQTKISNPVPARTAHAPVGKLGPYLLLNLLGQGGMGAVYLANQTTLDRNVALKVVKPELSKSRSMLARFTREAYAAAQLAHPNVVQIYDMGDDQGSCYFSMELVDGESLSELMQKHQCLDPQQAASYILHAAKGLQCAHNAGMVHRDIKPANLLLGKDGVVKVADLGLVKVPDEDEVESEIYAASALSASLDLTQWGSALGTPYYMAPEQARSAILVDHRADIYSLGCTFYVLLTGKRPFEGDTLEEVVSKHWSEPLVVPSEIVRRVPESLSAIVSKMMEKLPDDRYATIGDLIEDLENFLGVSNTAEFTPDEQDADKLEECAKNFNSVGLAKFRGLIPSALLAGCALLALVSLLFDWRWATGFLLMPAFAALSYFLVSGLLQRHGLFEKVRELVVRAGVISWIKWALGGLLLALATLLLGAWPWIVLGIVGVGIGVGFYFGIDLPVSKSRRPWIKDSTQLLKQMRLKGMDEPTLQMFVAKYSGDHWEEFFESHFGYPAKRRVRDELKKTDIGKRRPKFRVWRDRFSDSIDLRLEQQQTSREQKHLEKVEAAGLQEQGLSAVEAKQQAAQIANALVDHGDSIREAMWEAKLAKLDPVVQRRKQRDKVMAMLAEAKSGKYKQNKSALASLSPILNAFAGSYVRFLLGCCLIVGSLMWARQNDMFSMEQMKQTATQAKNLLDSATDQTALEEQAKAGAAQLNATLNVETKPLKFPVVGSIFHNFNSLVAGLILLFSAAVFGWRMTFFALPAALVALWGASFGIPDFLNIKTVHVLSALIGIAILIVGILFGGSEE